MRIKLLYICLILLLIAVGFYIFRPKPLHLRAASFAVLPGWKNADMRKSLATFQESCHTFLRLKGDTAVGSKQIPLQAKDWQPACKAAMKIDLQKKKDATNFFRQWFIPFEFRTNHAMRGLFTGYYLPIIHANLVQTPEYSVPIYALPNNIVTIHPSDFAQNTIPREIIARVQGNKVLPYYTRKEINEGKIEGTAKILAFVPSHIDRLFLEIQGSGVLILPNGSHMYLGYAGENGASYIPIGSVLIQKGALSKAHSSMQDIRAYLEAHPEEILPITNSNPSFVFFRVLAKSAALGAQGIRLTSGYSLAVDRKWVPLGSPLWLDTTRPALQSNAAKPLQRLMIAQDTGGAIRGVVRGDVFWGEGDNATYIAGQMKNSGRYWILLPRKQAIPLSFP